MKKGTAILLIVLLLLALLAFAAFRISRIEVLDKDGMVYEQRKEQIK